MRVLSSLFVCGVALLATSCHSLKTASQPSDLPLRYRNAQYDLTFFLPASWRGCSVLVQEWDAPLYSADYQTEIGGERGPIVVLRNPQWKVDDHYQAIPMMVFTPSQGVACEGQQRQVKRLLRLNGAGVAFCWILKCPGASASYLEIDSTKDIL